MITAVLALAWLLGVVAAASTGADPAAAVVVASLLAGATFALRPRPATFLVIAAGILLVAGASWRYDATQPSTVGTVAAHNDADGAVTLRGVIDDEPDERATGRLYRVEVRETLDGERWEEAKGKVLVRTPLFPEYEYGDLVQIEGELETPPTFPDFDYRDHLLRRGIVSIAAYPEMTLLDTGHGSALRETVIDLRGSLTNRLDDTLPEPQASLASGVLLGGRSSIPADLRDAMNVTGTSHLVAVSGQNVSLLAGLIIAGLAWIIGRRPAALLALVTIAGYAMLVGAQASVVRAAIMGAIYVMSIAVGRQNTAPVALLLAAAGMTALDPQVVHDVGFQLSFAATIGLMTLGRELATRAVTLVAHWPALARSPIVRPLIESGAVSLSAILVTLPITAVTFGRISLVALPANIFAVPAFVAVAFTSALALLASGLPGGEALAWLAWLPATYMTWVIELFDRLPAASIALGGIEWWMVAPCYTALAAATVWLMARPVTVPQLPPVFPRPSPRFTRPLALGAVLVAAGMLAWTAVLTHEDDDRLSVTFLDVGQGDATLIEGPGGQRVLVDGGAGGEVISAALGRALPFYDRRIDLVIATHPQDDHIGGLPEVIGAYDVGAVLDSAVEADSPFYDAWRDAIDAADVPRYVAERGQSINLGGGARLEVIGPVSLPLAASSDLNDASTVVRLVMGDVSFLLTADIEESAETALVRSGSELRATVLKVPHHGSSTSTSPPFLARVGPAIDVISVGAGNTYGHPTDEVLARLRGDYVLRTDEVGDVRIETDGSRIWVTTQR
ncbi:MAG: DNA internalization-related competence protein ComEC/Rec2 [Dehalococcoidia bacterium]